MFEFRLDGSASVYEQIYNEISRLISVGALKADERLPSVRDVAKSLGVNPNTVQKSYAMLERGGLIYSIPAKGSYVASDGSAAETARRAAEAALAEAMRKAEAAGVTRQAALSRLNEVWENDTGNEKDNSRRKE